MILHSYEIRNISSNWCLMDCQSFTYHPHSNECGPSSILALMVIILHFYSSSGMLILFIHYNITKLCRWWVAKTPIEVTFNPYPTSQLFQKEDEDSSSSLHKKSHPYNISPLSEHLTMHLLEISPQQLTMTLSISPKDIYYLDPFYSRYTFYSN
jgi:hypothetical protein